MKKLIKRFSLTGILILCMMVLLACTPPNDNDDDDDDNINQPPVQTTVSIIFNTGFVDVQVGTLTGNIGSAVAAPINPSYSGYRFSHWALNGAQYNFTTFPSTTIILDAVWIERFTIHFDTGVNGAEYDPIMLFEGDPIINLPIPPSKVGPGNTGLKFVGWLFNEIDFPFTHMPQMDMTLVAKWEEGLAIVFDVGDSDTLIAPLIAEPGTAIIAPETTPERPGYIFTGWSYNGAPYIFNQMPNFSITLVAEWIQTGLQYNQISNLPKMFINLQGNKPLGEVNKETYVNSSITVSSSEEDFVLNAIAAEFKGRGNGSWNEAKKGYRIKFFERQEMFGIPSSRHWVLLANTNFDDRTLAKNATAFNMAQAVFTDIEWSSSTYWVELYVNGNYHGVYLLAEHVRVAGNRIDIDSDFGFIDTGYLIEYDAYAAGRVGVDYFTVPGFKHGFTMTSPDPEDYLREGITESLYRAQVEHMRQYTTLAMQAALQKNFANFSWWADVDSFVDMYILHELFKNSDTGWSSFFMYKKPGPSGKLYAGAPWDFDASAGSSRGDSSTSGIYVAGSIVGPSPHTASELYINLMQVPEFKALVVARWKQISQNVKNFTNNWLSEEFIAANQFAMGRNFVRWNGSNQAAAEINWANATRNLRNWLTARATWLDGHWE